MLEATRVQWIIFMAVLVILCVAPGYDDRRTPQRPKKGFWRTVDVLWPIRRVLYSLWPANPELLQGYRSSLASASVLAAFTNLVVMYFPAFAKAMSPVGILVECAIIAFLIGRASGFWSADRMLKTQPNDPDKSV